MKQRFFFNGIDIHAAGVAVGQAVQDAVYVNLAAADTAVARRQQTAVGANAADHFFAIQFFIQKPFARPLPQFVRGVASKDLAANIGRPRNRAFGDRKRPKGLGRRGVAKTGRAAI